MRSMGKEFFLVGPYLPPSCGPSLLVLHGECQSFGGVDSGLELGEFEPGLELGSRSKTERGPGPGRVQGCGELYMPSSIAS